MMMMPFICSSFRRSVCAVCRCCDRSSVLEICGGRFPSQSAITSKKHLSSSLGFKSDFRIFRGGSKWSFSKRCCNSKACLWSHLSSSPIPEAGSDDPNFLLHAFFVIVKLACGLIFLYLPFRSQVDPNTLVVKVVVIVRIACGPHIYLACILEKSERDTIPHTRKE